MSVEAFIELTTVLCVLLGCSKIMVLVRVIAGSTVMIIGDIIAMSVAVVGVVKTLGGAIVIWTG